MPLAHSVWRGGCDVYMYIAPYSSVTWGVMHSDTSTWHVCASYVFQCARLLVSLIGVILTALSGTTLGLALVMCV